MDKGERKDGSRKNNHDEKAGAPVKEELGKSDKWAVGPVWRMSLGNPFAATANSGLLGSARCPFYRQCGRQDWKALFLGFL